MNLSIQTTNELSVKRFVERSKKIMTSVTSNHTQSISKSQLISKSTTEHADQSLEKTYSNELNQKENHMNVDEKLTYDDSDSKNFNYIFDESTVTNQKALSEQKTSLQKQSARQKISNYLNVFVSKRKRSNLVDDENVIEYRVKIMRAMTTLLTHDKIDEKIQN